MKIKITSSTYYPLNDGISKVTQYLAEGLCRKGIGVTILTKSIDGLPLTENHNGVLIKRFRLQEKGCKRLVENELISVDYDLLINENADCVFSNFALHILDKKKEKKILHLHSLSALKRGLFTPQENFYHYIGNIYHFFRDKIYYFKFPKYLKKYDGIICLSKYDESFDYLKNKSIKNVFVLGNACDDEFFNVGDEKNNVGLLNEKSYFLSVANYMARKNQIGILKSFLKTTNNVVKTVVFVGSEANSYYKKLVRYYEKHRHDNYKAIFLTKQSRDNVLRITKGAFAVVSMSTWEGYSVSLIEAMALGVPFISTNTGNASELPGGIIALPKQIAQKMDELALNKGFYNTLSKAGYEYASTECRKKDKVDEMILIIDKVMKHD